MSNPPPRPAIADRLAAETLSLSLEPFIFTPEDVPWVEDLDIARQNPALVVLSALCHGRQPTVDQLFPVLVAAMQATEPKRARLFYDVVLAGLPVPARERWDAFMTTTENYQYRSELFRNAEALGEAQATLIVLEGRGVAVPDDARDRILACTDSGQLETWLLRAATATTIDDVIY